MKIEFGSLRVVEVKLGIITCQLGNSHIHIHLQIPYEHTVKPGDILPMQTWVPIRRAVINQDGIITEIKDEQAKGP